MEHLTRADALRALRLDASPPMLSIDGRAIDGAGRYEVIDPATGEAFGTAPEASPAQLDQAVAAARQAQPAWASRSWAERRHSLLRLADLLQQDLDPLAALITLEQGKPLARARDEVLRAATQLQNLVAVEVPMEVLRHDADGRVELHHRPLGVVGAITPWNMPLVLCLPKITHALLTGNTIVVKPSPYTPLSALRFAQRAQSVLPRGVLNMVSGGNALGRALAEHRDIDKISFTGSGATGKKVMASSAGTLKRLTLELGGNDAAIVLADADPEAIAPQLFHAAFANSGQICMAIKRLYVHDSLHAAFCTALARLAQAAPVGHGFEAGVALGPVQNAAQYRIVLDILADARARGARFHCGGHAIERPGYFIAPTVVSDIAEDSRLVAEEPFGPVLPVLSFSDIDEVVQRANASPYGLTGSVWGRDTQAAARIAARLDVGTASVNRHLWLDAQIPFGGAKQSGLGSEYAAQGLKHYMQAHVLKVPA
ncbi:aldehyde dehydrogenase family protein [Comamonas testosteroni]|uniref:4-(hydroxymethyl)benzenesulfonate dehydrogenase n=1 Tax=Comamonas testosteroni TaxID=285 RepID=A0A096FE27_COMTE|nr:aldehyde dehydrogenase family protein [Comamonas testosteroni]KGH28008.1 aldehyde dehydrogenase [Comamonas testosteroni]